MKKILIVIASGILLLMGGSLYAQDVELTSVEKARKKLIDEVMERLAVSMPVEQQFVFVLGLADADKKADGDIGQEIENEEEFLSQFCLTGNREQREIAKWFAEERSKLPTTKTEEDLRIEKEREEQRKNIQLTRIKQRVAIDYYRWAEKGEFEKTAVWQNRLAQKGKEAFDSLCFVHFNEVINRMLKYEKKYDADREGLVFRFYYEKGDKVLSSVQGFLPVSPDDSQKIYNHIRYNMYSLGILLNDGYFFPSILRLYNRDWHLAYNIVVGESEPVVLLMSDVLRDPFVPEGDHCFDYNQYSSKMIAREDFLPYVYNALDGDEYFFFRFSDGDIRTRDPFDKICKYHNTYDHFYSKEYAETVIAQCKEEQKKINEEKEENAINSIVKHAPLVMIDTSPGFVIGVLTHRRVFNEETYNDILRENSDPEELFFFARHNRLYLAMNRENILRFCAARDKEKRTELFLDTIRLLSLPLPADSKDKHGSIFIRRFIADLEKSGYFDMNPIYEYILDASPYYAKKYRSGTLEERIEKFRRNELLGL